MNASMIRTLLACLLMPLCGLSCVAFRDFQVRPYLSDPTPASLTISILVEDYRKVATAVKAWANEQGLVEEPCRYYVSSDYRVGNVVEGLSPACQVFVGKTYSVRTVFTPGRNSTGVSVWSSTHNIADNEARRLREHLVAKLGARSISEYGGGEMPNKGVEPTR